MVCFKLSGLSALINTDYTPSCLMSNQVLLLADQIDGIVGIKPLHVVSGNTYRRGNVCPPENGDLHLVTDIHWLMMEVSHFSFWFHNDRPPSFVL